MRVKNVYAVKKNARYGCHIEDHGTWIKMGFLVDPRNGEQEKYGVSVIDEDEMFMKLAEFFEAKEVLLREIKQSEWK